MHSPLPEPFPSRESAYPSRSTGHVRHTENPRLNRNTRQERALKAEAELAKALQKLEYLEAQLRLLTAKRFGRSSEKTSKDQLQLFEDVFNEAESNAEPFAPEPELITVPAHQRAKRKKKKGVSLEGLPVSGKYFWINWGCGQKPGLKSQEVVHAFLRGTNEGSPTVHQV